MTGLPQSWAECRLSDIAEVNPSLDRCPYPQDGTVHFVPMGAVEAESGLIDVSAQRPYSEVKKGYTAFVPGDVLFAKITPCMENGKMAVVPDLPNSVGCGSTEFHVLRAKGGISPDYIYYYVSSKSFRFEAEHKMTGAVGQKRVPTAFVAEHTFPLPPIPEQHRIVARIEELFSELDASVESLTKARALLGLYRQSLLKAAFQGKLTADWRAANADKLAPPETLLSSIRKERETRYAKALEEWEREVEGWKLDGQTSERPPKPRKPERNTIAFGNKDFVPEVPDSWAVDYLGNHNLDVFDGPFGSNLKTEDYVSSGVRVIRLENVGHGQFIEDKRTFISHSKYQELKKHTVQAGDIAFSSFITDAVRTAIVPGAATPAINKADCFILRVHGSTIETRYLQFFLRTRNLFKQLEATIHGVGRPRVNTTQVKEALVPICSVAEQLKIVEVLDVQVSELDQMDSEITASLTRIAALRQSILKRSFSGRLVPQDPNDEPASTLLARLQSQTSTTPARRKRRA